MELNDFVQKFAEQFEETDMELFTAETKYSDLDEWSSLTALSIIAMVDEEMDKRLTGADIRNCTTIEELYKLALTK
jgi:acyl carrier protein